MPMERQSGGDPRDQSQEEDMDIGYDDNNVIQTFEGLEQRFLDDIMKLSKEQVDAEDAENARHRERINTINAQYEEQLSALRARHTTRRDEFLRKESVARQQHYQQMFMEFNPVASSAGESHIGYSSEPYVRERTRFPGGARDHRYESNKVPYPKGRAYNNDSGSHYY
ncbi:S-adenosyl-L-methionine-dependentmethyltransferases superfamily protein [Striga asiatica]|uniref:S-adenosyl-L-methionine-dependentmethyltransferases superfamily protein n=1 Tax=Striga asiatica TaxID=4170 RepID=A0A5A7PV61_STRAF|nr:S-adenosyl-L-methionine-dependentmethyltransferases superfamily protein [Striga asiatica]